jgi:hypothetical protein
MLARGAIYNECVRNGVVILLVLAGCKGRKLDEAAAPVSAYEKIPQAEVIADEIQNPISIAIDEKFVYWGDGGALRRAPKAGGAPSDVCRVEAARIESIAIGGGAIYFGGVGGGVFRRRDQEDAPCERIATATNPTSLAIQGDRLHYWNGGALEVALDAPGTAPAPNAWQAGYTGSLVVDQTHIFVHQSEQIVRMNKAGGDREVLAHTGHLGFAFALDDSHLYWGDDLVDGVLRVAKGGGPIEYVTGVWSIGATLALEGDWVYVLDIDANVHAIAKRDGRSAQIARGGFTGMGGTNNVALAFDREHFFIADDSSRFNATGLVHIDLTVPDPKVPDMIWEGAVARAAKRLDGVEFTPRPEAVEASTVYFGSSDEAQDWANATHFTRWRDERVTSAVRTGSLTVTLLAGVERGDEARARKRAEAVAQKIRDELGPKVVFEVKTHPEESGNVVVQFAPAAYARVWAP